MMGWRGGWLVAPVGMSKEESGVWAQRGKEWWRIEEGQPMVHHAPFLFYYCASFVFSSI